MLDDNLTRATKRVDASPELSRYRDLFVEYEWDNQEEHLRWVATAPESELIDWAYFVRKGEHELLF